jgi:hypothetical protein
MDTSTALSLRGGDWCSPMIPRSGSTRARGPMDGRPVLRETTALVLARPHGGTDHRPRDLSGACRVSSCVDQPAGRALVRDCVTMKP